MICPCRKNYDALNVNEESIIATEVFTDSMTSTDSLASKVSPGSNEVSEIFEYANCCAPIHKDLKKGLTPESIMRARYSSYVQKNLDFLEKTLDPQTRENFDPKSTREWAESAEFKGLKILKTQILGNKGIVEFKVAYRLKDEEIIHHEVSQFRRHIGQWFFREGKIKTP